MKHYYRFWKILLGILTAWGARVGYYRKQHSNVSGVVIVTSQQNLLTVAHTCLCSRLRINVLSKILQNISLHLVNNFLSSLSRITQTFLPALH